MNSLRAERKGTLDATEFLLKLYQAGNLNHRTKLLQRCDNKRVVQLLNLFSNKKPWYPNILLKAHMDVQLHIEHNLLQLRNTWNTKHVYGHQDRNEKHHKTWEKSLTLEMIN